jgi:hypothetical protein
MSRRRRTYTSDLLTHQQGEVLKVGFLKKKGHVRRNWLDRWFVLTTEGIYYYKSRGDTKPVGVIPLFGSSASEDTLQRHQFVFKCATAEGKDYPIQASTRDEMLVWVKAIEEAKVEREKRSPSASAPASVNPGAILSKGQDSHLPSPSSNGASGGATNEDSDESDDDEN